VRIEGNTLAMQLVASSISQLNVLLRAAPKDSNADAPNRIGFQLAAALEKGKSVKSRKT